MTPQTDRREYEGAYLPNPNDRCPTGKHVGALVAGVVCTGYGIPPKVTVDIPPRYVCGCVDPRKP